MANTTIQKIKVKRLGKFGFFAEGVDRGFNYSKNFKEEDKAKIVPGVELEGEVYVSDAGAQYLNKIVSMSAANSFAASIPPVAPKTEAKKFTPTYEKKERDTMSKAEWAQKDQRISRQGAVQAAVIALAPVVSLELLPIEAVKLAKQMLEFVQGE